LCAPLFRYHLKDVIVGKIYFLLVRIKIKHMELEIRRRESTGSGPNTYNESETLAKYEIMDGAPVRGGFCFDTPYSFLLFISSSFVSVFELASLS
jgi:hypothetical protein